MSIYKVYFSDEGLPATGLLPTWYSFTDISGNNLSQPSISGIAGGWYSFNYTASGNAVGVIYGSGLSNSDAYIPVDFTINDFSLDAAISSRPDINTIISSGNAANWSGVATGFATTSDVTNAKDSIISSGNANWITATGFATASNVTNARDIIIASGDANWTTASGMLTISDIYTAIGLNSSGLIDEISSLPVNPSLAHAIYLDYMQRAFKQVTDKTTGKVETYNASGTKIFEASITDDNSKFTKANLT